MAIHLHKLPTTNHLREVGKLLDTDHSGQVTAKEVAEAKKAIDAGTDTFTPAQRKAVLELELIVKGAVSLDGAPLPGADAAPAKKMSPLDVRMMGGAPIDASGNLGRLNDTQQAVVADVKTKAKDRSEGARAALLEVAKRNGYTEAEVDQVLAYIKEKAPVTVNIHPDKALTQQTRAYSYGSAPADMPEYKVSVDRATSRLIDALLVDGHYKNQFETGVTSGSSSAYPGGSRDKWEETIFEGGYHKHSLVPAERPKYGAMNAANNPAGPAGQYGSCYMVLKPGIKERTTFTPKNSSGCQAGHVGTAEHFQHILKDAQNFKAIMDFGLGRSEYETNRSWSYLEAQVHGPIDFAKDVAAIVVDKKFAGTEYETKIRKWAEQGGFAVQWNDGQKIHTDDEWQAARKAAG